MIALASVGCVLQSSGEAEFVSVQVEPSSHLHD